MAKVNRQSNWVRGNCIGRGSYGTVNMAVDKSNGQVFAVKSVDRRSDFDTQLEALENEIRILRSLSSPWMVEYLGDDTTLENNGTTSFRNLHLEYLPGGTVADLAKHSGNDVDENTLRSCTWCIVAALKYVHSKGIVHCDIKGKNVLAGPIPGVAKLADFGSAAEFDGASVSPLSGSPLWMAPEVVRREYQGPESDVWSLGCTVIEMVTGKPPWENRGGHTLCRIGYSDELPEIPTQLSELGRDFVDKCLRRNRAERLSCDQLLNHPFISSSAPLNSITHSSPRCVLDWVNSEFSEKDDEFDEEEEEEESSLAWELQTRCRERIGKLESNSGAIWESDGWVMVRNLISDRAAEEEEEEEEEGGSSSEYPNSMTIEEEMEYSDSIQIEMTNLESFDTDTDSGGGGGGGGFAVVVERAVDGSDRWRGWNWTVDTRLQDFTVGVNYFLFINLLLYFKTLICIALRFIMLIIYILFEISIFSREIKFLQTLTVYSFFNYLICYLESYQNLTINWVSSPPKISVAYLFDLSYIARIYSCFGPNFVRLWDIIKNVFRSFGSLLFIPFFKQF